MRINIEKARATVALSLPALLTGRMSMGYYDHIQACNRYDLSGFRRFTVAGQAVGWVRHRLAETLRRWPELVTVDEAAVCLNPDFADYASRSAAMAGLAQGLVAAGIIPRLRGEAYPVLPAWGAVPLLQLDRAAVNWFGINAYGLHVNGYVRRVDGGIEMWIARRASDRQVAPGKLDNLVAGGQPVGLTLEQNLIKESYEEAGIEPALARRAVPVGVVTYLMETPAGLKPDTLFLYDLELAPDFRPCNTDGEVEEFHRLPMADVAAIVRDSDNFKFNCNLVIIDFIIRHGHITPDTPGYMRLCHGLRRPDM
ncbi:DNA mismatch repair protein MutT [Azospirillaceae bacterium]